MEIKPLSVENFISPPKPAASVPPVKAPAVAAAEPVDQPQVHPVESAGVIRAALLANLTASHEKVAAVIAQQADRNLSLATGLRRKSVVVPETKE